MASFKKLANGKYQATIHIGQDANGKQIRKYINKDTLKECKAAARELEMEIKENGLSEMSSIKFSSWVEKWLEIKKPEISPSTYVSYKMYVNTHFIPFFQNAKLSSVTELLIRRYIAEKLKNLSSTTVRKHFFVLSDIFYMALKSKSPMKDIEAPKIERYKAYVPSPEEFELIHDAVKGMWDEIPILLAAWGGLRAGEIFALKHDDIDWKNETLTIDEGRAISEEGYIDDTPKSDRGTREVALPKYLMELLKNYIQNNTKSIRLFDMRPDSYGKRFKSIITTHNEIWNEKQQNIIKKNKGANKNALLSQLKIQPEPLPVVRFHDLRHYHATVLYRAGIPDQYAAQRLGHDIVVLKKIYQHLQLEDENKFDDKIKNLFEKKEGIQQ